MADTQISVYLSGMYITFKKIADFILSIEWKY